MLKLRTQQHIKFFRVEKSNATYVYALLVETNGTETISVSDPKLVQVVQKKGQLALKGSVSLTKYVLPEPQVHLPSKNKKLESPYFSILFGSEKSNFIIGLAAQPPTR
jgi:hypothetical protein